MIALDLIDEERATLVEVLESYLSDLRMEIADTDRMDFRNHLKRKKQTLIKVVEQLNAAAESQAP